jgi:hypothetical protein
MSRPAVQSSISASRILGKQGRVARILREPLVHFLFLGALLFVTYDIFNDDRGIGSNRIVIDDGVVASIVQRYTAVWQRPPTAEELRGLVGSYIHEEVLYREGVAMGLQDDDIVVKRRVRQKLDVLAEESGRESPPTDADLQAYLDKHAADYAMPTQMSFEQVMFNPEKHARQIKVVLTKARAELANGVDVMTIGDMTMLPRRETRTPTEGIARDFGEDFAHALTSLPVGTWQGPVHSGYGLHLVRVTERIPGRAAKLSEVRNAVERDWEHDRRVKAADDYYRNALKNYQVVVTADMPAATLDKVASK